MNRDEVLRHIEWAVRTKPTRLNLSGNQLSELPAEIGQLTQLQTLTLNDKIITPASEAPGPPDGALGRAEAKRAFGPDADTGAAKTISAPNFTADPLVIKAFAKVTNTSDKTDGVDAETRLKFSRIYKTKQVNSSGTFTVNMRGDIKGIDGKLITQNPFFDPTASMFLGLSIVEVDASGNPLDPFRRVDEPVFIVEDLDNKLELAPSLFAGSFAKPGDKHTDPGKSERTIKNNFNGAAKFKKKAGETLFFLIEGEFMVSADIGNVQSLAERLVSLASFLEFVELGADGSFLTPAQLIARASELINLTTGELTTAGMSGFAEADFFGTVDITVDATDVVPEPSTMLLLGFGLAGLGFFGRRRIAV